MKISRVEAILLRIPVTIPFVQRLTHQGVVLVLVHTDEGLTGIGVTRDDNAIPTRELINEELAPFLAGKDPLGIEQIWNEAWSDRRGAQMRMGLEGRAISAIDQALWDSKGKACNQPVFRLLGGASGASVPIYTTFGLKVLGREDGGTRQTACCRGPRQVQTSGCRGRRRPGRRRRRDQDPDGARGGGAEGQAGPQCRRVYNYVNTVRLE